MQGVGTTGLQGASRSARIVAIAAGSAALMVLAACTSGASKSNGNSPVSHDTSVGKSSAGAPSTGASTPKADAAVITVPAAAAAISPIRPVVVGIAHGTLTAVRMTNPAGKQVAGALAGDGSSWHSTEVLGYSKSYKIVASGKGGRRFAGHQDVAGQHRDAEQRDHALHRRRLRQLRRWRRAPTASA